ncbi:MAG: hypothetical protein OXH50_01050, partial [Gemmatimonadetes bacterium]|nr:hypothetical protein [Gemmatimonadota bacterium]
MTGGGREQNEAELEKCKTKNPGFHWLVSVDFGASRQQLRLTARYFGPAEIEAGSASLLTC